jgi:hypothetical protein
MRTVLKEVTQMKLVLKGTVRVRIVPKSTASVWRTVLTGMVLITRRMVWTRRWLTGPMWRNLACLRYHHQIISR